MAKLPIDVLPKKHQNSEKPNFNEELQRAIEESLHAANKNRSQQTNAINNASSTSNVPKTTKGTSKESKTSNVSNTIQAKKANNEPYVITYFDDEEVETINRDKEIKSDHEGYVNRLLDYQLSQHYKQPQQAEQKRRAQQKNIDELAQTELARQAQVEKIKQKQAEQKRQTELKNSVESNLSSSPKNSQKSEASITTYDPETVKQKLYERIVISDSETMKQKLKDQIVVSDPEIVKQKLKEHISKGEDYITSLNEIKINLSKIKERINFLQWLNKQNLTIFRGKIRENIRTEIILLIEAEKQKTTQTYVDILQSLNDENAFLAKESLTGNQKERLSQMNLQITASHQLISDTLKTFEIPEAKPGISSTQVPGIDLVFENPASSVNKNESSMSIDGLKRHYELLNRFEKELFQQYSKEMSNKTEVERRSTAITPQLSATQNNQNNQNNIDSNINVTKNYMKKI